MVYKREPSDAHLLAVHHISYYLDIDTLYTVVVSITQPCKRLSVQCAGLPDLHSNPSQEIL